MLPIQTFRRSSQLEAGVIAQTHKSAPDWVTFKLQFVKSKREIEDKCNEVHDSQYCDLFLLSEQECYRGQMIKKDGQFIRHGFGIFFDRRGNSYEGYWENDHRHGHGELSLSNGYKYKGEFKSDKEHGFGQSGNQLGFYFIGYYYKGQQHGYGYRYESNGTTFIGHLQADKFDGYGERTTKKGEHYIGYFKNGLPHGKGVLKDNEKTYKGELKNGKFHGQGTLTFADGRVLKGSWKESILHGEAKYTDILGSTKKGLWQEGVRLKWCENYKTKEVTIVGEGTYYPSLSAQRLRKEIGDFVFGENPVGGSVDLEKRSMVRLESGHKYDGTWIRGKNIMYGKGTLIYPDGSIYDGWFKNNYPHGFGRLIWSTRDVYEGEWAEGEMHGMGVIRYHNGNRYEGQFINHTRYGQGVLLYADGDKYDGPWKNDLEHGIATFTYSDGSQTREYYEHGKFIKEMDNSSSEDESVSKSEGGQDLAFHSDASSRMKSVQID